MIVLSDKEFDDLQTGGKVVEYEPEPTEHERAMEKLLAQAVQAVKGITFPDNTEIIKLLTVHHRKMCEIMTAQQPPAEKRKFTFTVNRASYTNLIESITAEEL
jgi:hypothetical protein